MAMLKAVTIAGAARLAAIRDLKTVECLGSYIGYLRGSSSAPLAVLLIPNWCKMRGEKIFPAGLRSGSMRADGNMVAGRRLGPMTSQVTALEIAQRFEDAGVSPRSSSPTSRAIGLLKGLISGCDHCAQYRIRISITRDRVRRVCLRIEDCQGRCCSRAPKSSPAPSPVATLYDGRLDPAAALYADPQRKSCLTGGKSMQIRMN